MEKNYLLAFALLVVTSMVNAQRPVTRAILNEDGQVMTELVEDLQMPPVSRDGLNPMPGFPLSFASNTTYKPMRGLALADLDNDGADEIILCHNEEINVIDGQGTILWTRTLSGGMAQYPAAVGDIDGDGTLEVVAITAYGNARGGVNVYSNTGTALLSEVTNNNPLICAPVLADITGDGQLEILFCGRGKASAGISAGIHAWNLQGEEVEGFPFELPSTPSFTPTLADIDGDGELELFCGTTSALYCVSNTGQQIYMVDGQEAYKYSYQSPLVVDFEGEGAWSLVGACHGDNPNHYVRDAATGDYREGWPKPVASWTYSAPTVFRDTDRYALFMGVSGEGNTFYQYDPEGNVAPGFPLNLSSGVEGFVSIADIDGDGAEEIITDFNLLEEGNGFIRAWEMDGTEVLEGFPLRPQGLTYMNGANFGDIDGDGNLEIVTLTYVQNFSPSDPVIVTAYSLGQPVENLVYGTYKGSNDRTGWMRQEEPVTPSCHPVRDLEAHCLGDLVFVSLHWNAPEEGSTGNLLGYRIMKDGVLLEAMVEETQWEDYEVVLEQTYEYVVIALYDDGCESASDPVAVLVEWDHLVENSGSVGLFPNPTHGLVHIEGAVAQGVEVYNILGQKVLEQAGPVEKINVENLDNGIYFVRLQIASGETLLKMCIEK